MQEIFTAIEKRMNVSHVIAVDDNEGAKNNEKTDGFACVGGRRGRIIQE
ncbi:MAG: hypothetical protein IKB53_06425 [Oscillospiraceae bacterium]|nr:hypothetical protein [Oscillospiraceae bacterium]